MWYKIKEGAQGLVMRDTSGTPALDLLCEPATRYCRVMTRADWMPCLVGEVI